MFQGHAPNFDYTELSPSKPLSLSLESALTEWKNARKQLDASIESMTGAYNTLIKTYALPPYLPSERFKVREIHAKLDYEVNSLLICEGALRCIRQLTGMVKKKLVNPQITIDDLPQEILARIFALSDTCFVEDEIHSLHNFAGVCTRWRRVAANMPTHVDVGPSIPGSLTRMQLERANHFSIFAHVYEPIPETVTTPDQISAATDLLISHVHRIRTLDIESYSYSRNFASFMLNLWLQLGSPSLARSLKVFRPKALKILSPAQSSGGSMIVAQSDNAQAMLRSLEDLELQNIIFNWGSEAYRGLVQLRLGFFRSPVDISISQLAAVLSESPALSVLQLSSLSITSSPGWSSAPITLSHLQVLSLARIDSDGVKLLLPLFELPACPLQYFGISATAFDFSYDEMAPFFAPTTHVAALTLRQATPHTSTDRFPPLKALPRTDTLWLNNFHISYESVTQASNQHQMTRPAPHISRVMLSNCTITLEGLETIVATHSTHSLYLDDCATLTGSRNSLEDVRGSLVEAHPELLCNIRTDMHYFDGF